MDELAIITHDYYKAISYNVETAPEANDLSILFYGKGILINNAFADPLVYDTESYIEALSAQIANDEVEQLTQREIFGKSNIFGRIAQRVSVYDYNYADHEEYGQLPRGLAYFQYIKVDDNWRIVSVTWCDENENHITPAEYLNQSVPEE